MKKGQVQMLWPGNAVATYYWRNKEIIQDFKLKPTFFYLKKKCKKINASPKKHYTSDTAC